MPVEYPKVEPRSADDVLEDIIDDLPPELSDRSKGSLIRRFIKALRPFYAKTIDALNELPRALELTLYSMLGQEPLPAVQAKVTLEFTSVDASGRGIPKGTVVKDGTGIDGVKFTTDQAIDAAAGYIDDDGNPVAWSGNPATIQVTATAVDAGSAPNALEANTVQMLESPIAGINSVTNPQPPAGGEDEEPEDVFRDRMEVEIRASRDAKGELMGVTKEDYELICVKVPGVARALSTGCNFWDDSDAMQFKPGCLAMTIVNTEANDPVSADLEADVVDEIVPRTFPGATITAHQPVFRRVYIQRVEVVLDVEWMDANGEGISKVKDRVVDALTNHLTAVDILADDGKSIEHPGWPWGEALHKNELVALIDQIDGIERVGGIWHQTSDDNGATWTAPAELVDVAAAADGNEVDFGLIQWGEDSSTAFVFETDPDNWQ